MRLRHLVLGLAGILLAGTASAQTAIPQAVDRGAAANVQPYAPLDGRSAPAQAYSPQEFRANPRGGWQDPRGSQPVDYRQPQAQPYQPEYRPQPASPPVDYRSPAARQASPYAPPADARGANPPVPVPAAAPVVDYRRQAPVYRAPAAPAQPAQPVDARAPEQRPSVQDFRNPAGVVRPTPGVQPVVTEAFRQPAGEARPGVIDPRIATPRKEEYIDYKVLEGRTYDFRPADYKPVDARTLDYRSQENRTPDQKVLDPRLKEKGAEIAATMDCRAILYRSVECNYTDYREVDPQLQAMFARYPELAFGIVPKEYSKELTERWQPLLTHLSAQIGLKVTLKIANDYQALAESQRAGLVHVAIYSPMAYARARASGVKIDAFAIETNPDGGKGAHALIYALAGTGAPRGDEVRGKSIGLVDPNSISGYFVPRMMFASQKLDPDTHLGKQVFTGSHENALAALSQGLVDLAVGEWRSDEDSTLARLLARGTLRHADGTPMRRDDFRVIAKSDAILNAPIAYLADLPDDLKAVIRRAMLEAPMRDRAAFEKVYDVRGRNWDVIEDKAYGGALDLVKFMEDSRARQQTAALSRQQSSR